jgi:hypothetical protein
MLEGLDLLQDLDEALGAELARSASRRNELGQPGLAHGSSLSYREPP